MEQRQSADPARFLAEHPTLDYLWYHTAYSAIMAAMTLGLSFRMEGRRHIPRQGPGLLIANHQSFIDPLLVGIASPRPLYFMARKNLFDWRLLGWLLRSWHTTPVDRDGVAKEGLKTMLGQLQQGKLVLIFPEGERTRTGAIQPFRPGIQLLIKRQQIPIIPVGIAGAYQAWPRSRPWPYLAPLFLPARPGTVAVSIGTPLDGAACADLPRDQLLDKLLQEVQKMQLRAEHLRRRI